MSLLEKVCRELGVEIGEVWKATDGKHYYIDNRGFLVNKTKEGHSFTDWIERVLTGELKPVWEPEEGETYYVPSVRAFDKYIDLTWTNCTRDEKNYKRNIIFKTKEEAIAMADKILVFVKGERENE